MKIRTGHRRDWRKMIAPTSVSARFVSDVLHPFEDKATNLVIDRGMPS